MQKIVIELPEEIIDYVNENKCLSVNYDDVLAEAIANGTVIPKGCGDLIDADELLKQSYRIDDSATLSARDVVDEEDIEDAPVIIEADKGDKR